jgi:hypothetical protein
MKTRYVASFSFILLACGGTPFEPDLFGQGTASGHVQEGATGDGSGGNGPVGGSTVVVASSQSSSSSQVSSSSSGSGGVGVAGGGPGSASASSSGSGGSLVGAGGAGGDFSASSTDSSTNVTASSASVTSSSASSSSSSSSSGGGAGGSMACVPKTCDGEDAHCGPLDDGCGHKLNCGAYVAVPICNADQPYSCACPEKFYFSWTCKGSGMRGIGASAPPKIECQPNAAKPAPGYADDGWCCR